MVDAPAPRSSPSRRSVMLGLTGAAALGVTGCSTNSSAGSTGTPATSTRTTPDVAVATSALTAIRDVREAVSATVRKFPDSRPLLTGLVALHRAHEASLVDAVPNRATASAQPATYAVPRHHDRAIARLAVREQHLHDTLDVLALKAQSGQFARLLGSMGAALHQRLPELGS